MEGGLTSTTTKDAMGQIVEVQEGDFRKIVSWCGKKPEKIDYFTGNSHICNVKNVFTEGSFTELRLDSAVVWRIATEDNHGRPSRMEGRGLSLTLGRDRYGRVATRYATGCGNTLQDMEFQYDARTGNMTMQNDYILGTEDLFSYDSMDRLVSDGHYEYGYDALGNVTQKQPFGPLGYNPARPYAVASVQGVSHFPAHSQAVTYNAAQQPTSISEGGIETTIGYSHDMQRSCMTVTEGDTVTLTQYYDNASYQRMTRTIGQSQPQTKELLYVGGDPYTAPAVMLKDYGENQWTLCYILRDNLGSVVSVADTLGNDLQHLSYDAWGRLRDPLTLSPYGYREEPELLLGRGYTGHEHLQWCGLINMNARLYDPMVARFLSPDPVVQAPDNTQSLNRYSYCLNNPLKYVDPTGNGWISAYYGNEYFYYYDYRVSSQLAVYRIYGKSTTITYEGEQIDNLIYKKWSREQGLSIMEFSLLPNGFFTKDGILQMDEYEDPGYLHIGSDFYTQSTTVMSNYYGNYLGNLNPECYTTDGKKKYSYACPPIDDLDYAAFLHDKAYDKLKCEGPQAVFLQTCTKDADFQLAVRAFKILLKEGLNSYGEKSWWARGIVALFGNLSLIKDLFEY